jgi:hypothetical protein
VAPGRLGRRTAGRRKRSAFFIKLGIFTPIRKAGITINSSVNDLAAELIGRRQYKGDHL